jgi:two-component system, LytTR family, response regulator
VKIRTLVVDDEPLARDGVRLRLEREADFHVLGERGNGVEAVDAIRSLDPDLVFLDVQMPGLTGFEVLQELGPARMPAVVFVTAYDQYAIRAFEANALDYLLKPIDDERFGAALGRVRRRMAEQRDGELGRRLAALLADYGMGAAPAPGPVSVDAGTPANSAMPTYAVSEPAATPEPMPQARNGDDRPARFADRLVLKDAQAVTFLPVADLDWVEADGDYMRLHAAGKSRLMRCTMAELERKLDPDRFARIHRSTIVNVDRIREMRPSFHGEYTVVLRDGTRLKLSRSYRDRLQVLVGEGL